MQFMQNPFFLNNNNFKISNGGFCKELFYDSKNIQLGGKPFYLSVEPIFIELISSICLL